MKSRTVKELMVPLAKYATVPDTATMFEAVTALEKAQQEFDQTRYRHRAVLVYDQNKQVVMPGLRSPSRHGPGRGHPVVSECRRSLE